MAGNDRNWILDSLPVEEHRWLRERGEKLDLKVGTVIYHQGAKMNFGYFPTSGLISLLGMTQEGHSIELGVVGREGFLGLPIIFSDGIQPSFCMVEQTATVCRIPADILKEPHLESLHRTLLRYAALRMMALSQTAVCNQFHSLKQRLCRWLLTAQDRTGLTDLEFTQELLSSMLGARRPVVTVFARRLRKEGAIRYRRGCITIVDRRRLEHGTCECYGVVQGQVNEYLRELAKEARMTSV